MRDLGDFLPCFLNTYDWFYGYKKIGGKLVISSDLGTQVARDLPHFIRQLLRDPRFFAAENKRSIRKHKKQRNRSFVEEGARKLCRVKDAGIIFGVFDFMDIANRISWGLDVDPKTGFLEEEQIRDG